MDVDVYFNVFSFFLKFIGLSVYGYFKNGGWYWFDDAFIETFKVSAIAFVAVFIRAKIYSFIELKNKRKGEK